MVVSKGERHTISTKQFNEFRKLIKKYIFAQPTEKQCFNTEYFRAKQMASQNDPLLLKKHLEAKDYLILLQPRDELLARNAELFG